MIGKKITWTEKEEAYIKSNWGIKSSAAIAKHIGKVPSTVRTKARSIGLPGLCRLWTVKEETFLASFYGHLPIEFIATSLTRSTNSCLNRVFKLQHDPNYTVSDRANQDSFKLHSNLLKAKWKDPKYRKKMSKMTKDLWKSPEFRSKQSQRINLLKMGDPEFLEKFYAGRLNKPNKAEQKIDSLLQTLSPGEFAYNGDFSQGVMLGGLIPDFINVNGKKAVIELFGNYWHDKKGNIPWKSTEFGRQAVFSQLGYKLLVIWEHELKDPEAVVKRIKEFNEK